jgi:hypothetical protein
MDSIQEKALKMALNGHNQSYPETYRAYVGSYSNNWMCSLCRKCIPIFFLQFNLEHKWIYRVVTLFNSNFSVLISSSNFDVEKNSLCTGACVESKICSLDLTLFLGPTSKQIFDSTRILFTNYDIIAYFLNLASCSEHFISIKTSNIGNF